MRKISKFTLWATLATVGIVSEAMPLSLEEVGADRSDTSMSPAACAQTLPLVGGMSAPFIADHLITASSVYGNSPTYGMRNMWRSRIDTEGEHGWATNANKQQWIQWDLLKQKTITEIKMKGGSVNG